MVDRLRGIDAAGLPRRLYRFPLRAVRLVAGVEAVAAVVVVGVGVVVGGLVLTLSCAGMRSWLGLGFRRRTLPPAAS